MARKHRDFDSLPTLRSPNPLPCGCAIMGINVINLQGTMTESRDMHIKFCPLHDAAKKLLEALKMLVERIDNDLLPKGDFPGIPSGITRAKAVIATVEKHA